MLFILTDGNSNKDFQGMDVKKKRGEQIYTIGYGAPAATKVPLEEIAAMTGGRVNLSKWKR